MNNMYQCTNFVLNWNDKIFRGRRKRYINDVFVLLFFVVVVVKISNNYRFVDNVKYKRYISQALIF